MSDDDDALADEPEYLTATETLAMVRQAVTDGRVVTDAERELIFSDASPVRILTSLGLTRCEWHENGGEQECGARAAGVVSLDEQEWPLCEAHLLHLDTNEGHQVVN